MHLVQWVVTSQARTEKWTQSNRAKPRNGEKWDQTLHEVAFNSYLFCEIMNVRESVAALKKQPSILRKKLPYYQVFSYLTGAA